jgi:predicted dehydrogenase
MLQGGVIGFGNMGQKLTRYINESERLDARIVAVCNRGKPKLDVARNEFGLWATHDPDDLLSRNLDFVLILSTSYAHASQVVKASEAGCHIFCEKPIALSLEDADHMIEASEKADVVTVVNYIMRYNEGYIKIKELIDRGELGEVLSVTHSKMRCYGLYAAGARHRAIVEPEESGGWIVHHACHDIDFLYWLLGPIRTVYALTQSTVPHKRSEEVVLGMVVFENGAIGSIGDSVCGIRDHYTRIIGSKASLAMTGENEQTVFRLHREGVAKPELLPFRDAKRPGGGLDHFFECIRQDRRSPNSLRSARHSLAAALAMKESARTGKPVTVGK